MLDAQCSMLDAITDLDFDLIARSVACVYHRECLVAKISLEATMLGHNLGVLSVALHSWILKPMDRTLDDGSHVAMTPCISAFAHSKIVGIPRVPHAPPTHKSQGQTLRSLVVASTVPALRSSSRRSCSRHYVM